MLNQNLGFKIITISNVEDIQNCNFNERWLFRGQSQDWKLKSSIENLLDELGLLMVPG